MLFTKDDDHPEVYLYEVLVTFKEFRVTFKSFDLRSKSFELRSRVSSRSYIGTAESTSFE